MSVEHLIEAASQAHFDLIDPYKYSSLLLSEKLMILNAIPLTVSITNFLQLCVDPVLASDWYLDRATKCADIGNSVESLLILEQLLACDRLPASMRSLAMKMSQSISAYTMFVHLLLSMNEPEANDLAQRISYNQFQSFWNYGRLIPVSQSLTRRLLQVEGLPAPVVSSLSRHVLQGTQYSPRLFALDDFNLAMVELSTQIDGTQSKIDLSKFPKADALPSFDIETKEDAVEVLRDVIDTIHHIESSCTDSMEWSDLHTVLNAKIRGTEQVSLPMAFETLSQFQ